MQEAAKRGVGGWLATLAVGMGGGRRSGGPQRVPWCVYGQADGMKSIYSVVEVETDDRTRHTVQRESNHMANVQNWPRNFATGGGGAASGATR